MESCSEISKSVLQLLVHPEYQVQIKNARKSRFQSSYKFERDRHRELEINVVYSGCCVMEINQEYVPLKVGDCVVIYPDTLHSCMVDVRKNCSIIQLKLIVNIPDDFSTRISLFTEDAVFYKMTGCENIGSLIENIANCHRTSVVNTGIEFALAQLYVQLSEKINKLKLEKTEETTGVISDIITYLHQHMTEELNIELLAKQYHISSRYIRKCFQKNLEMSCSEYITMLRIANAKEMLWNSGDNITQIALAVGFNSSQYFSRVFLKHTGMTPGEYREKWYQSEEKENEYEEF